MDDGYDLQDPNDRNKWDSDDEDVDERGIPVPDTNFRALTNFDQLSWRRTVPRMLSWMMFDDV